MPTSLRQAIVRGVQEGDHRWFRVLPPVALCAALWGSAFPGIKTIYRVWAENGVQAGLSDYWWLAGVRFTLAGLMLLVVARNPWTEFKATDKRLLLGFAVTQTFGQYLLFYYGVAVSSGALAGLMSSIGSFWWMLLAPLIGGAPWPRRSQWLALLVGAVGVTLAAAAPGAGAGKPWIGTLMLAGATGLGAVGIIQFGKLRATIGARAATGFSLFIGGLGLLAMGGGSFPQAVELMPPTALALTVWLAFVSAFAFSLWNHLSTLHPIPLLAGYRFLIPIMGMIESVVILREKPGWGLIAGGVLVIGALFAAQWSVGARPAEMVKRSEADSPGVNRAMDRVSRGHALLIFSLERWRGRGSFPPPLPGRSQFPRERGLRKVRTPQGNAPHENGGREPRGTRTDSAAESTPPMARKGTGKGEMVE